jgi:hypothetical protein
VNIVADGSGVGLHMEIIIGVLPNDTSNSSDCEMSSDWLMSGEFSAKTFNGYHVLTGSTVWTFFSKK